MLLRIAAAEIHASTKTMDWFIILDEKGNKIGVPIKASLIHNNPGLKFLEQKFVQNQVPKQRHKQRVKKMQLILLLCKNQNLQ
jgi:hypothetical protein